MAPSPYDLSCWWVVKHEANSLEPDQTEQSVMGPYCVLAIVTQNSSFVVPSFQQ